MTLAEIRTALRHQRELIRSFDGGDRAPSPPASLLRHQLDLERQERKAIDALWKETVLLGKPYWELTSYVSGILLVVTVYSGGPHSEDFELTVRLNQEKVLGILLNARDAPAARDEAVYATLRLLEGGARGLRTLLGLPV